MNQGIGKTILQDLRRDDLTRSFRLDWRELKQFFLDDERRARLKQMGMVQRAFVQAWWLLKQLILSLTPTRRLLMVAAIALILFFRISIGSGNVQSSGNLQVFGLVIFLLLIMLEVKDKLLATSELEAGRKVQAALIPVESPKFEGWDIWMFTRPANTVGGDLVDYLRLAGNRLGLALGDVAGKGLGAALMMAKLQATLRALAPDLPSLKLLGERMNDIFCRDGMPQRFASLVYLELQPSAAPVRLLNAGHLPPVLVRAGGNLEQLPRGAPALGIVPGAAFEETACSVEPGDLLVVTSDGVVEARNEAGLFFGDERLQAVLRSSVETPAERVGRAILRAVDAFVGEAPRSDDLSLILLRRLA
jgi:serine phosphatase RsbU (regulator of sigma subunit)